MLRWLDHSALMLSGFAQAVPIFILAENTRFSAKAPIYDRYKSTASWGKILLIGIFSKFSA
ncbi:hypothetical protein [Sphingobium sp. MK2]|uniref:hypothetical protein n=1 Tax=Sphingobium sp. MK2 TaxID=3116540 RepID=UPI0032E35D2C